MYLNNIFQKIKKKKKAQTKYKHILLKNNIPDFWLHNNFPVLKSKLWGNPSLIQHGRKSMKSR
jgi:hypothetical protein